MAGNFQAPKGVAEYVWPDSAAFLAVRQALSQPAQVAGYGYIELPVFEDTGLYVRGVGESTDVVSKEMYTFDDRGGRSLTLRPEGTAGVVRAVIEHSLDRASLPVKLWYAGQFFRAERPQQGRYRQFSQVGVEALGSDDPALDAEVIALGVESFARLGLQNYRLLLNSLGDAQSRQAYRDTLTEFLGTLDLDEATQARARLNPLRVLDDKRPEMVKALADAPLLSDSLTDAAAQHHAQVCDYLRELGIQWTDAPRLVRGLDYYTKTTFEFVHDGLGAQSALGGGGRYDGLMQSLGGQEISGIGFGLGVDRTMLACQAEGIELTDGRRCDVFVVPFGEAAKRVAVTACAQLRAENIAVDMAFDDRSMKASMKAADRSGARVAIIIGDDELAAESWTLKDLASGEQNTVTAADGINELRRTLA